MFAFPSGETLFSDVTRVFGRVSAESDSINVKIFRNSILFKNSPASRRFGPPEFFSGWTARDQYTMWWVKRCFGNFPFQIFAYVAFCKSSTFSRCQMPKFPKNFWTEVIVIKVVRNLSDARHHFSSLVRPQLVESVVEKAHELPCCLLLNTWITFQMRNGTFFPIQWA